MLNCNNNIVNNKSYRESINKSAKKSIYSGNKLHTTSMNLKVSNEITNQFIGFPLKEIICNKKEDQRNKNYNQKDQQKIKMIKKNSKYTNGNSNGNRIQQESAMKKSVNISVSKNNNNQNHHPHNNQQRNILYDQTTARVLQTQRFNRQTGTYRRSIEIFKPKHNRLKTDINQQIIQSINKRKNNHEKNKSQLSHNHNNSPNMSANPSPLKKVQNFDYPNTNRLIHHHVGNSHKNQKNQKNQMNFNNRNDIVQIKIDELKSLLKTVKCLKKDKQRLVDELKFFKKSSHKENSSNNSVMKALGA